MSQLDPNSTVIDGVTDPIMKVRNLAKHFAVRGGGMLASKQTVKAVDGLDFSVGRGEALGLVGESGCGKTTTGRMLVRLLEPTAGSIEFDGRDITRTKGRALRQLRRDIQIIFQDPYSSLNPRQTVGKIVATPFVVNKINPPGGVKKRVQELLEIVGLNPEHYNRFPHEFSGGQRQRIGIARALALQPKLIIADEPVSALDVSIQAQVVNLLRGLQKEFNLSFVFIAHDLSVVRHFCDRIAVMYLGKVVEVGDRAQIYETPSHPYTKALLSAVPDVTKIGRHSDRIPLEGDVPTPMNPPSGCRFRTRCYKARQVWEKEHGVDDSVPYADRIPDACRDQLPPLIQVEAGGTAACHYPEVPAIASAR